MITTIVLFGQMMSDEVESKTEAQRRRMLDTTKECFEAGLISPELYRQIQAELLGPSIADKTLSHDGNTLSVFGHNNVQAAPELHVCMPCYKSSVYK